MKKKTAEIIEIPIKDILIGKVERAWKNPDDDQQLLQSIKTEGIKIPIFVRRNGNKYEIIKGGRRFIAAKAARLNTMPAILRELDDKQALLERSKLNMHQKKLSPFDQALEYQRLIDEFKMEASEVALELQISERFISDRIKLLHLTNSLQKKVFDGDLSLKQAVKIVNLSRDSAKQEAYAEVVINHKLSPEQLAANYGKSNQKRHKTGVEKSTGLKLVTRMKGALELLLAVNENIPRFDPRELQMIAEVNSEIHKVTGEIEKKITEKGVVLTK